MSAENIQLSFTQGSSDKVYHVALEPSNDGYLVNFAYGRRGKPLKTGTKTAKPLPYDQAKHAYDKLVQEKRAKGYTPDKSGVPFTASVMAPDRSGYLPQLLNPIEIEDIPEALRRANGALLGQVKYDGERRIVIASPNEAFGTNRKGLKVGLQQNIVDDLLSTLEYFTLSRLVLDTEDMGDHLKVFDVLEWDESITDMPCFDRLLQLFDLNEYWTRYQTSLHAVDTYEFESVEEVESFINQCRITNEEGIVLRDGEGIYEPGRPNSWGPCLKIKFYATATCKVESVHATKRSIGLEVFSVEAQTREEPFGNWISVGNCTIPPNYAIPAVGDLVEIKYLYAYRGGSLYQPQYKGVRTDLELEDANISQLKFKD